MIIILELFLSSKYFKWASTCSLIHPIFDPRIMGKIKSVFLRREKAKISSKRRLYFLLLGFFLMRFMVAWTKARKSFLE